MSCIYNFDAEILTRNEDGGDVPASQGEDVFHTMSLSQRMQIKEININVIKRSQEEIRCFT